MRFTEGSYDFQSYCILAMQVSCNIDVVRSCIVTTIVHIILVPILLRFIWNKIIFDCCSWNNNSSSSGLREVRRTSTEWLSIP